MTSTARSACFFRCCFRQELLRHWNAHGNTSISHCSLTNGKTGSKCPILDCPHWAQEPPDRFICRQQNLSKPDTDVIIWQQRCHFFTLSCSEAHRGFTIFIGFTTKRAPILLSACQDYWNDDPPLSLLDLLLCSGRASELTAVQQAGFFIWLPLTSGHGSHASSCCRSFFLMLKKSFQYKLWAIKYKIRWKGAIYCRCNMFPLQRNEWSLWWNRNSKLKRFGSVKWAST